MANRYRRSQMVPSPSTAELRFKLARLVSRHEQMKIVYHQLKSQINDGLLQAEEVFASLAIPLTKLVGLKTVEMAEEGRFTTIIIDSDLTHGNQRNGQRLGSPVSTRGGDQNDQISALQGESYSNRATIASKELVEEQQTQLIQLVNLLREIETHVNLSQDNILQTLENHNVSLHNFFQRAINYVSTLHSQNHDTFLVTMKLLQAIFNNVNVVLGSVKDGVEDLMQELAERMCNPMVDYVKGLRDDMKNGTCVRLLAMVEEMDRMITDGRLELADARKKVRMAEEGKIEALCKLKATKERVRRMKDHLSSLSEPKRGYAEFSDKFLSMEEDQAKGDKVLWDILKKKRIYQAPESPMGPKELISFGVNNENHKSKGMRPSIRHRPVARSYARGLGPQAPCFHAWIPLGSSPSVAIQPVVSCQRITP